MHRNNRWAYNIQKVWQLQNILHLWKVAGQSDSCFFSPPERNTREVWTEISRNNWLWLLPRDFTQQILMWKIIITCNHFTRENLKHSRLNSHSLQVQNVIGLISILQLEQFDFMKCDWIHKSFLFVSNLFGGTAETQLVSSLTTLLCFLLPWVQRCFFDQVLQCEI